MAAGPGPGHGDAGSLAPVLTGLLGNTPGGRTNPLMRVVLHMLSGTPAKGVPGGVGVLLEELAGGGLGAQTRSWVAEGRNQPVSGKEITDALGEDEMNRLAARAGLTREETAAGIAMALPTLIDAVTPNGELPDQDELDDVVRLVLGEVPAFPADAGPGAAGAGGAPGGTGPGGPRPGSSGPGGTTGKGKGPAPRDPGRGTGRA